MKQIAFTTVNIILAVFLYFLTLWYKQESVAMNETNKNYIRNTKKLQDIKKIDQWLQSKVKKHFVKIPENLQKADLKLIAFFDAYAKEYNFEVEKFIYKDEYAHFLDIKYSLSRGDYKNLMQFMQQQYQNGYILFKKFLIDKDTVKGELQVVQPYPTKEPKKKEMIIDDVPQ